jgi:hypothetical protein
MRSGRTGGWGIRRLRKPPAQKHRAVCADRLEKIRTTRAIDVDFASAVNLPPITARIRGP